MNDIFEPRPLSLQNAFSTFEEALFEQDTLDTYNWDSQPFSDEVYIQWLNHYYFLSPVERTYFCLGLNDKVWDSIYLPNSFYGFDNDATESEWDNWFYAINRHTNDYNQQIGHPQCRPLPFTSRTVDTSCLLVPAYAAPHGTPPALRHTTLP